MSLTPFLCSSIPVCLLLTIDAQKCLVHLKVKFPSIIVRVQHFLSKILRYAELGLCAKIGTLHLQSSGYDFASQCWSFRHKQQIFYPKICTPVPLAHPASYSTGTVCFSPGIKQPVNEVNTILFIVNFKKEWKGAFSPRVWLHGLERYKFTPYLYLPIAQLV